MLLKFKNTLFFFLKHLALRIEICGSQYQRLYNRFTKRLLKGSEGKKGTLCSLCMVPALGATRGESPVVAQIVRWRRVRVKGMERAGGLISKLYWAAFIKC